MELGVRRKAEALFARGNHPGHKGAVAQPILQRLLVGPVGPLFHLLEVGVGLAQGCKVSKLETFVFDFGQKFMS